MWERMKAPPIAIAYWRLSVSTVSFICNNTFKNYVILQDNAMMRDVLLAIRADEGHHREVNHTLASMKSTDTNPYGLGR